MTQAAKKLPKEFDAFADRVAAADRLFIDLDRPEQSE
jgi:hypothetical protein